MLTKKTTAILTLFAIGLILPPPGGAWSWPVDGPVLRGFEFTPVIATAGIVTMIAGLAGWFVPEVRDA